MPGPRRPRLRKREIAIAVGAGALASFAAAGILSDGFGGPGSSFAVDQARDATSLAGNTTYALDAFEELSTVGPQDVVITAGDSYSVRPAGPADALGQIEVVVEDGELIIRARDLSPFGSASSRLSGATFYVTVPRLERVSLAGSGNIRVDRIEGESFTGAVVGSGELEIADMQVDEADFTIGGSGNVSAAGTAGEARIRIGGSGEVQAQALRSRTASVSIAGSGDVTLSVEDEAEVSIAGSGDVAITGTDQCEVSRVGSGNVTCDAN